MSLETERNRPGRTVVALMEVYQPDCILRYGETTAAGTCPAILGIDVPGEGSLDKCFQTLKSCPVPLSFLPEDKILRFSTAQQDIPAEWRVRPTIVSVDSAPRRLNPARGLGEGAKVEITLLDHPWHDIGLDPYYRERPTGGAGESVYTPIKQGTYWGKWLARNPFYRGWRMRVLYGYISPDGFSLDDFEIREYVLDKIEGPNSKDRVKITGTDVFSLLEKDRSVVPPPSLGELAAGIDEAATEFTLSPAGIGDTHYQASFRCVIGNEGFDVTRAGDVCTITTRGLYRGLDDHEAEDKVQVVRRFEAQQVNQIAEAIITEAQPQLSAWIDSAEWQAEADTYLTRLYSGDITEPTGVNELLAELMDSVPVHFWPDEREQKIRMRAIKPPDANAQELNDARHYLWRSLDKKERPKDRVDAVLVNFGLLDPTEDIGEQSNYSQGVFRINEEAQADYGTQQLRIINSRWISRFNKPAADDLARLYIRRYRETPLTITFALDAKRSAIWTGDVFSALTRKLQGLTGAQVARNFQLIESHPKKPGHRYEYEAESYDWWVSEDDQDAENLVIISDHDFNMNLRTVHDSIYASVAGTVRVVIEAGVIIGSHSALEVAARTGDWPAGTVLIIENKGRIQGKGGPGGAGGDSFAVGGGGAGANGKPGQQGGHAFLVEHPIEADNISGEIWAGGGGGGGGAAAAAQEGLFGTIIRAGGGGAGGAQGRDGGPGGRGGVADDSGDGTVQGDNGAAGQAGTEFTNGAGGAGGALGDLGGPFFVRGGAGGAGGVTAASGSAGGTAQAHGDAGSATGSPGAGGAPGDAVQGDGLVTWVNIGDIRGTRVT